MTPNSPGVLAGCYSFRVAPGIAAPCRARSPPPSGPRRPSPETARRSPACGRCAGESASRDERMTETSSAPAHAAEALRAALTGPRAAWPGVELREHQLEALDELAGRLAGGAQRTW